MVDLLSTKLETPANKARWRPLTGDDDPPEKLRGRMQKLEERLNKKKEQLLEKQLILEEVSGLGERLHMEAAQGREQTIDVSKQLNSLQTNLRVTTRKMMATVAELSMYQATAIKLQQEKHDKELQLEDAKWRLEHGQPPTDSIEQEWYKMERERLRSKRRDLETIQQEEVEPPPGVVRSTAEPRPNAYIADEIGIPQPYGRFAPYKPPEPGSSMRHIRKPVERQVQL